MPQVLDNVTEHIHVLEAMSAFPRKPREHPMLEVCTAALGSRDQAGSVICGGPAFGIAQVFC